MNSIEVEVRSFISEDQYHKFLDFFNKNAKFLKEDDQETHYFDGKEDLRIQKNNYFSKIWLKSGKIHDEAREEIELRFPKEDFEKLQRLFSRLGYNVKIKWFRKRHDFDWDGMTVSLDYTKGYGHIIELEKLCSEAEKEATLKMIKGKLAELNIKISSREEFDNKFKHYEQNWQTLIK